MIICDEKKCTGCFACMNICPQNAITPGYGFLDKTIPIINSEKCVNCNLCQKVCPVNNPLGKRKAEYSIAAWSNNEEDAFSSSGGVAAVFSRYVLKNNGIVYGTTSANGNIYVISIIREREIDKLRGSKYVQTNVGMSYRSIKSNLDTGDLVLFISTPCQIAGLKNFLKKDYQNLISVDLICHGVSPKKYLDNHLSCVLKNKKYDEISFRGKNDFVLTVNDSSNIIYQKKSSEDYYFKAFLDSVIFRDNCYECPYSCPERCSDITLGDFWGLNKKTLTNKYSGKVSVVLPNTSKGVLFFEKCCDNLTWERRDINEACNVSQENLLHPSIPGKDRVAFEKYYPKYGFEKTIKKYTFIGKEIKKKETIKIISRNIVVRATRKIIKICLGAKK